MRVLQQESTAIGLALLYLVVGATGESLHYLCELDTWFGRTAIADTDLPGSPAKLASYHHCHGPDFLWHTHQHVAAEAAGDNEQPTRSDDPSPAYEATQFVHSPHACPLLAIVAKLKQGSGGACALAWNAPSAHATRADQSPRAAASPALRPLPRGPPAGSNA